MTKFVFYLLHSKKYRTVIAKDEATAVWRFCNQFRLIEYKMNNWQIVSRKKVRLIDFLKKIVYNIYRKLRKRK
jgi:hypothetical protein